MSVHESVTFPDGRVFYSTRDMGQPIRFQLGAGQVIDGVDEGVTGMRIGERRQLVVPPNLSQRTAYPDGLSPDDILHYDIELIAIESE